MGSWHSGDFTELEFRFSFGCLREEKFCMQKVKFQYTQNHCRLTDKSYQLFSSKSILKGLGETKSQLMFQHYPTNKPKNVRVDTNTRIFHINKLAQF